MYWPGRRNWNASEGEVRLSACICEWVSVAVCHDECSPRLSQASILVAFYIGYLNAEEEC